MPFDARVLLRVRKGGMDTFGLLQRHSHLRLPYVRYEQGVLPH